MPFKFGVLQNVLGEPLETVFSTAKELGFDGVELDWNAPEEAAEGGVLAPEKRAGIKQAALEAGVEIHAVCAHFLNGGGIASADEATRERGMKALLDGFELAKGVGATALLVPFFGPGESELADAPGRERALFALQVLAGEAAKAGVTIAIESALPTLEVTRLIDATRSSHVGAYWDMANGMSLGFDPLEDVRTLGSRISRVHAKEFQKPADAGQSRQPGSYPGLNPVVLGQGDVPIADILRELKRVGYKGFITLETGAFGDRKESARAARQVLADAARGI